MVLLLGVFVLVTGLLILFVPKSVQTGNPILGQVGEGETGSYSCGSAFMYAIGQEPWEDSNPGAYSDNQFTTVAEVCPPRLQSNLNASLAVAGGRGRDPARPLVLRAPVRTGTGRAAAAPRPLTGPDRRQRLGAYAVCIEDGRLLLVRLAEGPADRPWTLPGGGLDHGEDPADGALRELVEETGFRGRIVRLLGIHSWRGPWRPEPEIEIDFHVVRIVYQVEVVGGTLRHEVDGSTDRAEWIALDRIADLDRVDLVDIGLRLLAEAEAGP